MGRGWGIIRAAAMRLHLRGPFPGSRRAASVGRALLLAGALLGLSACTDSTVRSGPEVGLVTPDYSALTMAGEPVSLADLRGEVVLLNVWATWCYPCRKEMPSLQALEQEFGDAGLRVVAVSIDREGNAPEIDDFLEEFGITFTVLHDPGQDVAGTFRTRGVPETWLIDRDGVLVQHWIGIIDGHSDAIRRPVMAALAAGAGERDTRSSRLQEMH